MRQLGAMTMSHSPKRKVLLKGTWFAGGHTAEACRDILGIHPEAQ